MNDLIEGNKYYKKYNQIYIGVIYPWCPGQARLVSACDRTCFLQAQAGARLSAPLAAPGQGSSG